MLIKSPHLMFVFSLILGTILASSSSSWLIAWIGLEINLMSFIPLLIKYLTQHSLELSIKYFLVQAMASMILMFTALSPNLFFYMAFDINLSVLLSASLAMKAGVAPLHFWFPQVMAYAEWPQALLIMTWQKIAPLILLSFNFNYFICIMIMASAVVGMLGGLNQTSFKKILTYSSIIHSSWLISLLFISDSVWWIYFIIYAALTSSIVIPLNYTQMNFINDINRLKLNLHLKIILLINILSLAGLPPFLGFFIKLISINVMLEAKFNLFLISILIISSLIAFYFYSRLVYSTILLSKSVSKFSILSPGMEKLLTSVLIISLAGNLLLSFIVLLT